MSDSTEEIKYPKHVFIILVSIFLERFSTYGMQNLVLAFYRDILLVTDESAWKIHVAFRALTYTFPVMGALFGDSWIGKYPTIITFYGVYIVGALVATVSTISPVEGLTKGLYSLGLILITAGAGTVRIVQIALGADQYRLPQQRENLMYFFCYFWLAANLGNSLALIIIPTVTKQMGCFGKSTCHFAGDGTGFLAITVAMVVIISGRRLYRIVPPVLHVIIEWLNCIVYGIKQKIVSKQKVDHWLDHSEATYGKVFVSQTKITLKVIVLLLYVIFFWALFESMRSDWIWKTYFMDTHITSDYAMYPRHTQLFHTFFVVLLIPVLCFVVIPICTKCGVRLTPPLRRMAGGGLFGSAGFFIAGFLTLYIETDTHYLPGTGESHLRFYNPLDCTFTINAAPYVKNFELESMDYKFLKVELSGEDRVNYTIEGCEKRINKRSGNNFLVKEKKSRDYFVTTKGLKQVSIDFGTRLRGDPRLRIFVGNPGSKPLKMRHNQKTIMEIAANDDRQRVVAVARYTFNDDKSDFVFYKGANYRLLVFLGPDEETMLHRKFHEIGLGSRMHVFCQLPQYFVVTAGEVLVGPAFLELAYTQAPSALTCTMLAITSLFMASGMTFTNVFQTTEVFIVLSHFFFFLASLMLLVTIPFIFLARKYQYVSTAPEDGDTTGRSLATS